MTALTAPAVTPASAAAASRTEARLRSVLRTDAAVAGAFGLWGLLGPSWYGGPPWVARAVGAALLLIAVEVALWARSDGSRLRRTGLVVADLAFAWVVGAALAAALIDMDALGREVLALSAVVTLGFAISETRLVRRLG